MKHLFIVNPIAGGRDKTPEIQEAVVHIFASGGDFEVYTTRAPMDGEEKVRAEAAVHDTLRVYAVGGDGTLNECVNGAAGLSNVAVAVYPSGTGNDFVRMFGAEKTRFLDLRALTAGEVRKLDLIGCNGRYGLNICSVGVDARIGTQVHHYSRLPLIGGKFAYVSSTVVNLMRGVNQRMRISFDGRVIDGMAALVCVCNGRFYGGGFNPVPEARPDDGILDFVIIRGVSRFEFIRLIGKYASGRYRELPEKYLAYYRGDYAKIESDNLLCINIDGETMESHTVEFKLVTGGLNFIFPRSMDFFNLDTERNEENVRKSKISH
ncbi:MAG: diacylglycerol kinase family protein [Oscillospiraceae bacterium]